MAWKWHLHAQINCHVTQHIVNYQPNPKEECGEGDDDDDEGEGEEEDDDEDENDPNELDGATS